MTPDVTSSPNSIRAHAPIADEPSLFGSVRRRVAALRWHRKARRKRCVGLSVSNVPRLLERLASRNVPSVVLRWFDDVPRTPAEERRFTGDVDLLVDGTKLETVIALAADQPGPVRCDLYSSTGRKGSTFAGVPCYPPVLAEQLLDDRELHNSAFFVPRPVSHLRSLAYHLVYHKGLASGIPSGCHLTSDAKPKRDYGRLFTELSRATNERLESPITLASVHRYLQSCGWHMPFDLLARWPKPTAWHNWLLEQERETLQPWATQLPELLVFFLREDVTDLGLTDSVCRMLSQKFSILAVDPLSADQTTRVMREVRGGDWLEHGKTTVIRPKTAVVCYDFQPQTNNVHRAARSAGRADKNAFPFVTNANVFFKHEIRRQLQTQADGGRRIHGIHGGDNAFESQHMLRAIYGEDSDRMNRQFLERVLERTDAGRQLRAA